MISSLRSVTGKVAWLALVSSLWAITSLSVWAHETSPGIADVTLGDTVRIDLQMNGEAYLAGVDLSLFVDTNEAPEVETYDRLRALDATELEDALVEAWPELSQKLVLEGAENPRLTGVAVEVQENIELGRNSLLQIEADPVEGAEGVVFGWQAELGPLIVRLVGDAGAYAAFLAPGDVSGLMTGSGVDESAGATFVRFLLEGVWHIIPLGIDHILFVLGLFFFALKWGPLLWQVSAFTVAHTVTLALATLGIINIPDDWMWLVEAIIALSITYVAIENIFRPSLGWWRTAVVFAFGLLHGLGFASVLGDLGLSQGQFLLSLVAFNIGVEVGQLIVIVVAFAVLMVGVQLSRVAKLDTLEDAVGEPEVMFRAMSILGSLLIAFVGAYWFVERAFL